MINYLFNTFRVLSLGALIMLHCSCSDDDTYGAVQTTPPSIEIELAEFWNNDYIAVEFTPSKNASAFIYGVGKQADRADFLAGILETQRVEGNDSQVILIDGLNTDEEYMIFAVALDDKGAKGPLSTMVATTFEGDIAAWVRFIAPTSLAYSFKASTEYRSFEYALVSTLDDISKFEKEIAYDPKMTSGKIEGGQDHAYKTLLINPVYQFTGTYFELTPQTDHYVLYRAQDRYTGEWSRTFVREVKTPSKDEHPYIDVHIDYVDYFYSKATFTPNDLASNYYVYTTSPKPFEPLLQHGAYAGDVMGVMEATLSSYFEYAGKKTENFGLDFVQDYTMSFYIAVCDQDGEIVSIQFEPYQIPAYDEGAAAAEIKIVSVDMVPGKLTYTFEPNDATHMFFVETFDNAALIEYQLETDLDFTNFFRQYYLRSHNKMAHRNISDGSWWKTVWVEEYSTIDIPSGTEITLIAAPMNINGLNGWGKVARQKFTIP